MAELNALAARPWKPKPEAAARRIHNEPHQHAFVLVGEEHLFGVHMTQYHCEIHKYQLILELRLPPSVAEGFRRQRTEYPTDTFILGNDADDLCSIPQLASGARTSFRGNIFHGLPPAREDDEPDEHPFPWKREHCDPVFGDIDVEVARVVLFRPFAHHEALPPFATYWLFGRGGEAHVTNLQTARLATGPFEPAAFGPDYDHVMSLEAAPDWLDPELLEAGVVVTAPDVPLVDGATGAPTIPCRPPLERHGVHPVLYRGLEGPLAITAGATFLFCLAVNNSPSVIPCPPEAACFITPMPEHYLR